MSTSARPSAQRPVRAMPIEYLSCLLITYQRQEGMDVDDGRGHDSDPESEEGNELFEVGY
jgi:hypothetical protein